MPHRRSRHPGRLALLGLCAVIATLAGCASTADTAGSLGNSDAGVQVTVPAQRLPGLRYAWVPAPHEYTEQADPRVLDPALRQRLRGAMDAALAARGYQRVEQVGEADWVAAYRVGVREGERLVPSNESAGSGPTRMNAVQCTSAGCSQLVVPGSDGSLQLDMRRVSYVEGALQIEAIDPHSAQVLWSAVNRGSVRRSDSRQARLDAIAAQTLQAFPAAPH
ncbi:MAG TPA: DUF4136 domain-containing protein [Stenotrophomonas sp.]|nr:DUF4136 domain-containing protein [Stenotrophomonas sp.]